jgi:hypothetical protein
MFGKDGNTYCDECGNPSPAVTVVREGEKEREICRLCLPAWKQRYRIDEWHESMTGKKSSLAW